MTIINKCETAGLTEFGKAVKKALIDMDKPQTWLIDELHKKLPNKYVDRSNLSKILKGQMNSPEIKAAINEIIKKGV